MIFLETPRLMLRTVAPEDAAAIHGWRNDPPLRPVPAGTGPGVRRNRRSGGGAQGRRFLCGRPFYGRDGAQGH